MANDMNRDFPFDRFPTALIPYPEFRIMTRCIGFSIEKRITIERAINPFYPRIRPFSLATYQALVTYITYRGNERAFRCVTLTATGTFHELRL